MGLYQSNGDREPTRQTKRSTRGFSILMLGFAGVSSCSSGGSSDVNTECSRLAPHFLSMDQRVALCRQATTAAPADCAKKAHAAPRMSGSHILELCSGALSDLPGHCVVGLSKSARELSPDLRIELCKGALSHAPAQCVEHSARSKRHPQLVVDVCKGASSVAPAQCLDMLPQNLSDDAAVSLCGRVHDVGPATCANARGQLSHVPELAASLCQGASGRGPADCFRQSTADATLSTDERVQLCRGANSEAPARCTARIRDHRVSAAHKVALCHGASGTAPATCFASTPTSMRAEDRVALCQGADEENPTASAACLKAVPQDLSSSFAVALCRGSSDSRAAAECAKVARHAVRDASDHLLALCRGALSTAPAHCAKAAMRVGADAHLTAALCSGSTSLAPASCFAAAPREIPGNVRVETCAGAQSTSPALCLATCLPHGLRADLAYGAMCPLDPEAGSIPRRGIDYRLSARLCRNASDDNPARCARAAPLRMSDDDVETLCAAGGLPSGEETAKCATAALAVGLSRTSAASLCRGADSSAPSACAETAARRLGEAGRVAVCAGASSTAPARCANSLSIARSPSASEIADCRGSVPIPSALHIEHLGHDGDALFPDQPMYATLEVWDQWGGIVQTDSSTTVRASVAARGSNGVVTNADGRFNASSNGIVHFSRLSFSGSGNLTLQFSLDGNNGSRRPLAAARVIVAETEHGATIRRCKGIFSQLACPWFASNEEAARVHYGGNNGEGIETYQLRQPPSVAVEAVSTVSGGPAPSWYVMTCQRVLEENGINVAYVPSLRTSGLSALLWHHPGIEALETGAGLPTREQPAWESLGVDRDASAREVRRAYHRQSLLWHPDRWVRYAMYSARAQDVFEIVGDAFAYMVASFAADTEKST